MVKLSYEKNLVVLLPFFLSFAPQLPHDYFPAAFGLDSTIPRLCQLLGLLLGQPLIQFTNWAHINFPQNIIFLLRRKNDKNVYFMAQRIRIWVQFDFVILLVIFVSQLQHSKSRSRNNLDLLIFEIANILKVIMTNNLFYPT